MNEQNPITKDLSDLFPLEEFGRVFGWTGPETSARLPEHLIEFVRQNLRGSPEKGCLYFQKLPDGGYEIKGYW
ncbi:MAG: hypothetical protein WC867_03660 [Candidatus Pacearchaeota archaeon]|jgi:hypothetical protein